MKIELEFINIDAFKDFLGDNFSSFQKFGTIIVFMEDVPKWTYRNFISVIDGGDIVVDERYKVAALNNGCFKLLPVSVLW